ncbi:11861_t:CDS:2 [Gigaspora rosea]|nr:11861_t:CDS:2 [Gigaspora rosea]
MTITSSITTNRTKNESDTNSEKKQVTCNRKPRTYSRTQRIKVTTVGKANNSSKKNLSQEKQRNGNCSKCKESEISMKMLGEHVGRLEQLVSDLAKTAKNDDRSSTYSKQNLGTLFDVSTCSLEDLQKLMITTTNIMYPQKSSKIVDKSNNDQNNQNDQVMPISDNVNL